MRRATHNDSSSMGGILAPQARQQLPKNYHRENLQMMKKHEIEV